MGRKKKVTVYEAITISDIGSEGKSVAKINDRVIFTAHVIPGDVVDLQVTRKKKRYSEAKVIRVREFSKDRIVPFCEHFTVCGGCRWQFLPYEKQLYYKEKQVVDQLTRIGKLELPAINSILGSEKITFYRNKLEFTFSNRGWLTHEKIHSGDEHNDRNALGFHIPGLFDKVLHIKKCWLQPEPSNAIRNFIYKYVLDKEFDFFNIRERKGLLRNLIIRTSLNGELMVIVVFFRNEEKKIIHLLDTLKIQFPEITSLFYVINSKANASLHDQEMIIYAGKEFIIEEMNGLKFKISPKSFFQTNSSQALHLYETVRAFADLSGKEVVYDLYSGTGTIANFIAHKAKRVVGIEYIEDAILDARENARFNNISNAVFFTGDIKDLMTSTFMAENGHPDVVIADPPRAGMHSKVVEAILAASPARIVYVSCNPGTQARDLAIMSSVYRIKKVQPVDMFPHTQHVENVVLLEKL